MPVAAAVGMKRPTYLAPRPPRPIRPVPTLAPVRGGDHKHIPGVKYED